MTDAWWAESLVARQSFYLSDTDTCVLLNVDAELLLRKEHARSVRIVKRFQKAGRESVAMSPSAKAGYELACKQVLAALTKGRGKGRK